MSGQSIDLRASIGLIRRRGRIVLAAAAVGLLGGGAYVWAVPPQLTSTALVLLPAPTSAQATVDTATQVRIATSSSVLAMAGRTLNPPLTAKATLKRIAVSAPTNQVIQIDGIGTDGIQAQQLAQAVASAYVTFLKQSAASVTSAATQDLHARQATLQAQVNALQREINATTKRQLNDVPQSTDAKRDAQLLAALQTEQAGLALQLDKVKDEIITGTPTTQQSSGDRSMVIQAATPPIGPPLLQRLVTWLPLGALAGAALAAMIILMAARRDPRAVLRDDIADAVGSPVLAAVRSRAQRNVSGWSNLLETYEPSPTEAWSFRQVLRALAPPGAKGESRSGEGRPGEGRRPWKLDHPLSVLAVSMSGDVRSLAVGVQFAAFAASLGIVTRLEHFGVQEQAATLWAALATDRVSEPRPGLLLPGLSEDQAVELHIVLTVVDRREPTLRGAPDADATLLTVTADTATAEELAHVALAVDDAGRRVNGIVVADPDPSDRTSGRYTLEERVRRVPLPMRVTGLGAGDSGESGRARR